jgi:DNA-binding response OmpR family regulator
MGTMARVLVVDDDPILADLLCEALQDDGYCARTAADAVAAYASIVARWPDLMLLDVHLPGIDGWTLLRMCRQDAWAAQLPVVMLAAPPLGPTAHDPRLAFLPKPFDLAALTGTVQELVARGPVGRSATRPGLTSLRAAPA